MEKYDIKEHSVLTKDQCEEITNIIIEMIGAHELYGGSIVEGHIDYTYHVDATHTKATTTGVLTVKVNGDFENADGEFIPYQWYEIKLEGPDYYNHPDEDGYDLWSESDFYYTTVGTKILNLFLTPDEIA